MKCHQAFSLRICQCGPFQHWNPHESYSDYYWESFHQLNKTFHTNQCTCYRRKQNCAPEGTSLAQITEEVPDTKNRLKPTDVTLCPSCSPLLLPLAWILKCREICLSTMLSYFNKLGTQPKIYQNAFGNVIISAGLFSRVLLILQSCFCLF